MDCDQEPIHLIGNIQLHGCLLTLSKTDLTILFASSNAGEFIDPPTSLLGKTFSEVFGIDQEEELRHKIGLLSPTKPTNILTFKLEQKHLSGHIFESEGVIVLEIEMISDSEPLLSFFEFYQKFSDSIAALQGASTVQEVCDRAVIEIRAITGFDRVWIHHVTDRDHLYVMSEQKREDQTPFLGMYFPGTDIPAQARRLYTINHLRLITDIGSRPCELLGLGPLDLSLSVLRGVSPVHIEYLFNMGVRASMSVSILKQEGLWGLISCHHDSPHVLTYAKRSACEFIGQLVSLQIPILEAREKSELELKLRVHLPPLISHLTKIQTHETAKVTEDLLGLVGADGAVISFKNEELILFGKTPKLQEVQDLVTWLSTKSADSIYMTDELSKEYDCSRSLVKTASGVMSISLSRLETYVVAWFRNEQVQVLPWGGNPDEALKKSDDGLRFSPRKSFELWNQMVSKKSLPWKKAELSVAMDFRHALSNLIVERAEQLLVLNRELEASNNELDSFAYVASHDLKEPLRGIHTYASFLMEDYGTALGEAGVERLKKLTLLTERMDSLVDSLLNFSRVGRLELDKQEINLNDIVNDVVETLELRSVRIVRPLPTVLCDGIRVSEVFHNLIINALKYNESPEKKVSIGWEETDEGPEFYVEDNGIGIPKIHEETIFQLFKRLHAHTKYGPGSGAGLTIVKKIVERHGGYVRVDSTPGKGSRFSFTLCPKEVP
jgi:chemotaxis family two-component system sensor kinase Cph1